jgi:hypothetical protein
LGSKNLPLAGFTLLSKPNLIPPGRTPSVGANVKKLAWNFGFPLQVDKMLAEDIAKLMTMVPLEEKTARQAKVFFFFAWTAEGPVLRQRDVL